MTPHINTHRQISVLNINSTVMLRQRGPVGRGTRTIPILQKEHVVFAAEQPAVLFARRQSGSFAAQLSCETNGLELNGPGVSGSLSFRTVFFGAFQLITYGRDRQHALDVMRDALDHYVIRGVTHNMPLLRDVVEEPRFRSGDITSKYLFETYPDGFQGKISTEEKQSPKL